MKTLKDYQGEEAIELWADIMENVGAIFSDEIIVAKVKEKQNMLSVVASIMKTHSAELEAILLRIDDTPVDGRNILVRGANLFSELVYDSPVSGFFDLPSQNAEDEHSGDVTASTEATETM